MPQPHQELNTQCPVLIFAANNRAEVGSGPQQTANKLCLCEEIKRESVLWPSMSSKASLPHRPKFFAQEHIPQNFQSGGEWESVDKNMQNISI